MNSLIDGTNFQKDVVEFQMARQLGWEAFEYGEIGKGWWRGFLRRNGHRIVTQRGEKFAVDRSNWTTLDNISQMYDIIYDEMIDAKIAKKMEVQIFMDQYGNEVDESHRFGKKVDTEMTHPEYCIFGDETRCNTSMKTDGHIAGTKYITKAGTQAQRMACTNEGQFTVLPFLAANREPVCCVVIFQLKEKEPKLEWGKGLDIKVEPVRREDGEIDIAASKEPGKYHPGGLQCNFNGKTIKCLTFCSDSGGITTEILIKILKHFDEKEIFPCIPGGPIPFLLVD